MKTDEEINIAAIKRYGLSDTERNGLQRACFRAGAKWHQEQDQWVAVSERLPEAMQYCLLIDGVDQYLDVYEFIPKGHSTYPIDLFRSVTNSGNCEMHEVTHWMPLPHPPKEKDNG